MHSKGNAVHLINRSFCCCCPPWTRTFKSGRQCFAVLTATAKLIDLSINWTAGQQVNWAFVTPHPPSGYSVGQCSISRSKDALRKKHVKTVQVQSIIDLFSWRKWQTHIKVLDTQLKQVQANDNELVQSIYISDDKCSGDDQWTVQPSLARTWSDPLTGINVPIKL